MSVENCFDCRNTECPFNQSKSAEDYEYYECSKFKAQYAEQLDKRNKEK